MNSVSIVNFLGPFENGVSFHLSFFLEGEIYEMVYWFNKENQYRLIMDPKFYEDYNTESIYQMPYLEELLRYIDLYILPTREDIWREIGI